MAVSGPSACRLARQSTDSGLAKSTYIGFGSAPDLTKTRRGSPCSAHQRTSVAYRSGPGILGGVGGSVTRHRLLCSTTPSTVMRGRTSPVPKTAVPTAGTLNAVSGSASPPPVSAGSSMSSPRASKSPSRPPSGRTRRSAAAVAVAMGRWGRSSTGTAACG